MIARPPEALMMTSPQAPATSATTSSGSVMTFHVLHSFTEAERYREAWNELVHASGTDIYQTFDWCRIWWSHYGARRQLHLLLCFSGEKLVGLVPAFIETLWLGSAPIRVAKLVGSDFSLQLCNLPVLSGFLQRVISQSIHHFLKEHRCDLLLFGPLSGPSARIDGILNAGRIEIDLVEKAESLGDSCTTRFDLPPSFEEYLDMIGSRQRGNYSRSLKQFEKSHRVITDTVEKPADVCEEFENFRFQHEVQWSVEGKLGHFGDWPKSVEFNRDLVQCLSGQGRVRFFRILADGQFVSSQFCFLLGGTNYWRLPARASKSEWDKLSLGKMGLIQMAKSAMGEGHHTIEGGRGHYDYKLQLGGAEWPLRSIQFTRRGAGVSARVRAFRGTAALLNLAYYKVIFARLAPRFPVLQSSLWPVWIRSTW